MGANILKSFPSGHTAWRGLSCDVPKHVYTAPEPMLFDQALEHITDLANGSYSSLLKR